MVKIMFKISYLDQIYGFPLEVFLKTMRTIFRSDNSLENQL